MSEFKAGDKVIVMDNGCSFTTYRDFFRQNGLEQFEGKYAKGQSIPEGETYSIVGKGKHEDNTSYGALYVLRSKEGKIYIGNSDNEYGKTYMKLAEPAPIKAYDLMKLAVENQQEYEGRRYAVVGACVIEPSAKKELYEVKVNKYGQFVCGDNNNWAYVNVHTTLEEILPEPEPVPFMEAAEANENGKTVECKIYGCFNVYRPHMTAGMIDQSGRAVSANEILHGKWYIIGKEG